MREFLADHYLWIKSVHVMAVIAWMAALLYLPRLFVYHAGVPTGSDQSELFKVMERRLHKGIMTPSLVTVWVLGVSLAGVPGLIDWSAGWIWVKLACVVALTGLHHVFGRWRKAFAEDRNTRTARTFRVYNEVPAVLMVVIVIMVIVKPF